MFDDLMRLLGEESALYPHQTEAKYPRIVEKIELLWGTELMSPYFKAILFDDRGDREGFPADVMTELFALSNFHESNQPSRGAIEMGWQSNDLDRLDRSKK